MMTDSDRAALAELRKCFSNGVTRPVRHRVERLRALLAAVRGNRNEIIGALANDLNKSEAEVLLSEYLPVLESLKYFIRRTRSLAAPQRVRTSFFNWPSTGRLIAEPYGVVQITSTWNYPFLLALDPVIGAVAAGNCIALKLSPVARATELAVKKILEEVFPPEELWICLEELPELLKERFDAIFFTGGAATGKLVAAAAAQNLTPCTLELGGKSPCIVDSDAAIDWSARRIVWGKFLNAGQTCVAPDYLLVHRDVKDRLTRRMRHYIKCFYGENPQSSPDYARIINSFHYERLTALIAAGRLIAGGECNPDDFYIAPTVIDQIPPESPLMTEEIFGPILPVLEFETIEDAVALINRQPKPLALYYFGSRNRKKILARTSSGSVNINDTVTQLMNAEMPFGGVGASGVGAYHGKYSFATFSHLKPVQYRYRFPELPLRFPPFSKWKLAIIRFFAR